MASRYITLLLLILSGLGLGHAQQVEKSGEGSFVLQNATIVTVTNGTIQGSVVISDGKIQAVGQNVDTPTGSTVVDCSGLFVYPGFIDSGTQLGLSEVGSVSLTRDFNELGNFIPHMEALTAVNPNSVSIPVTRVNGVTTVLASPTGGIFSGTAALINLHGYTPQQMFAGFKGVIMNYPSSGRRGRFDRRSDEDIKKENEKANKRINEIWTKAVQYSKIDSAAQGLSKTSPSYSPEMAALLPVVRGERTLLLEVNKDKDIQSALKWLEGKNIKVALTGVAEGWRVAEDIAKAEIPVITGPILRVPSRSSDRYDAAYTNAGAMVKAGIKVAIRTNETENVRNLPFNAGFAAAYGMGVDEALKAITINPAEIFGVADKYGSIEVGKVANLVISDGDPFETKTGIRHLFIEGWKVPLESRHTLLYDEFLDRQPGVKD